MAARLNPRHSELVIRRIKTSQLVNRLQNHALNKLKIPMLESQVRAAAFLIERTLARAQAPLDIALTGTIIVEEIDPTRRDGDYQRRRTG